MTLSKRRPTTYRLTPDLDRIITFKARKLGISKNAFVQMTLSKALEKELYQENFECSEL